MSNLPAPIDPNDIAAKVAVNAFTEIFKSAYHGAKKLFDWGFKKNEEHDFFGTAARRYTERLEKRYSTVKILGMREPVPLRSIYTRVNILEKITSQQRSSVQDLEQYFDRDRRGFGEKKETVEGSEVVNKLSKFVVLGKPGAGKTTFLKHTVLQAADGLLKEQRIPIFIELKRFSDGKKNLMEFIVDQFDICGFKEAGPFIEKMLESGKCLLLLDGLDEVSKDKETAIINEIRDFSDKYCDNQFIISCRIASYSFVFDKFTDVEMADFNDGQIKIFINSWFGSDYSKAEKCWKEIENEPAIKELGSLPLLLTLLCLVFDETMSFPKNRAELYKEAIDALLKKWDASRGITRDDKYKNLSLIRKENMLSYIAANTFEAGQYFIPQRTLEKHIADFVQHIQSFKDAELEVDSEVILKSIEAQHGIFVERAHSIYSFSHLTFQEYFTAKYIVDNVKKGTLERLVENHIADDKWREVFLLTADMLADADEFVILMKNKVAGLVDDNLIVSRWVKNPQL